MKITHGFLALSLATALAGGCTTKKYYTTGGDGGTEAPASVSNISPSLAFTGATLDVQLTGSATNWDASTTVDFGSDVKVNKITVASASSMTANITVSPTAMTGTRDVTVTAGTDAEPYKMTFNVQNQVDVTFPPTVTAGSIFEVTITNNDLAHPFDTTTDFLGNYADLSFNVPAGFEYQIINATPTEVDVVFLADVMATTGPFDIDLLSGADPSTAYEYKRTAVFTVGAAPTPMPFTNGTNATIANPYSSTLYTYTPAAANDLVTFSTTDTGMNSSIFFLHKSGSFMDVGATDAGPSVEYIAPDTTPVYVLVINGTSAPNLAVMLGLTDVALNVQSGGEGDDTTNNAFAGAVSLSTPPVIVQGASLSSAMDQDWYKLTVPAGKVIHATTLPGDANTDTVITFYNSDGTTALDNQEGDGTAADGVDNANQEDAHSVAVTTAGIYYVKISYSASSFATPWAAGNSHYDLFVELQ